MAAAEVTIEIASGVRIVATIDLAAVFELDLAVGGYAYAVVETGSIMVTVD
jgi:molybdopterin-binding protein